MNGGTPTCIYKYRHYYTLQNYIPCVCIPIHKGTIIMYTIMGPINQHEPLMEDSIETKLVAREDHAYGNVTYITAGVNRIFLVVNKQF